MVTLLVVIWPTDHLANFKEVVLEKLKNWLHCICMNNVKI